MKKNKPLTTYRIQNKQGFTLIEALVAIFILTISVTGLLGVVSQSVFNSNYAKNKTTATALAQEGIELVRNIQDQSLLNAGENGYGSFQAFVGAVFLECSLYGQSGGFCEIDPATLQISPCPTQGNQVECRKLSISPSGYYDYSPNNPQSPFRRTISVEDTSGDSGKATVTVSWMQGSVERKVEYETELFFWIK